MNNQAPCAAMDLGSNTFRLIVAEKDEAGQARNKQVFQHIPRLSENLENGGDFAPEALSRAWKAIEDFSRKIKDAGAERVLAGGTMAFRVSSQGPGFMAELADKYGWRTKILSGVEEGQITAHGVLSGLAPLPSESLIFDIGGRSTEFVSVSGREIIKTRSLDMGVVGLTEKLLKHDPPKPAELSSLAAEVRSILSAEDFTEMKKPVLVGTAGTVTTVAALLLKLKEYDPLLVNNAKISWAKIFELAKALSAIDVESRIKDYHLPPRRADAIVAGLAMVLEIMDRFKKNEITVSDNGLLEGLWFLAAGQS